MNSPPDSMNESGTQRPVGHVASCDASDAGTSAAERQWAPPFGSQDGSEVGSSTGGPVCGHWTGPASSDEGAALAPPSSVPPGVHELPLLALPVLLPMSHAPVLWPSSGEMHGAHSSWAAHVAWGSRLAYCET
jgi:hypothetical protein